MSSLNAQTITSSISTVDQSVVKQPIARFKINSSPQAVDTSIAQVPDPNPSVSSPGLLPQDVVPPPSLPPLPEQTPTAPPPQPLEQQSPAPQPESPPSSISIAANQFIFKKYDFANNVESDNENCNRSERESHCLIFTNEQLRNEVKVQLAGCEGSLNQVLLCGRPFALDELIQIAAAVAQYYSDRGYSTSGAVIYIPEEIRTGGQGDVTIRVIEGELEGEIQVLSDNRRRDSLLANSPSDSNNEHPLRLTQGYIRSRINSRITHPLNVALLQEALQLLQLDPFIQSITAELSAGSRPGTSSLTVRVREADVVNLDFSIDNSRTPSIGSLQRGVEFNAGNLTGLGDTLRLGFRGTDGSSTPDASYSIPINPQDGTLTFSYNSTESNVIEPPFDVLNISSNSRSYELSFRQPISRTIRPLNLPSSQRSNAQRDSQGRSQNIITFQEFALGLTLSRRESESFLGLYGEPYQFSLGADRQGRIRVSALRFFQELTRQNAREVLSFRSQFSLGLDLFNATVNNPIPGVEPIPDSQFLSWLGQAQWFHRLDQQAETGFDPGTFLLARTNIQLATGALLPVEQLGIGGFGSVRGYRQDTLSTDNGIYTSVELQYPFIKIARLRGVTSIIPFIDFGAGWNVSGSEAPDPPVLASVGLGLQIRLGDDFSARLDWGIPLVDVRSRRRTWQENGLNFSVQWSPF